jgi:hypothetical protein
MLKNQLTIYPKYATQHILYQTSKIENKICIPVFDSVKPLQIHCNHAFELITENKKKWIHILTETYSQSHSNAFTEIYHDQIEIFIKIPEISWTPNFTLYKNNSILTCFVNIVNETNFEFDTRDIVLVFRSIDHEYKIEKEDRDIPTIDSSNYVSYSMKEKLSENFVLREHFALQLWSEKVEIKEFLEVDIEIRKPKYVNSYMELVVPQIMLPGQLEIIYRLPNHDLLHLGSIYNKIHLKDSVLQIMFPMNKSIQIKNILECKHHSFFIEKSNCKLESKIKKHYDHPIEIQFFTHKPIKSSSIPYIEDHGVYCWKYLMTQKEDLFKLEFTF